MKTLRQLAVLLLTLSGIESAPAVVLTFDDLPAALSDPGVIPDGYGGLKWYSDLGTLGRGPAYYYNRRVQYLASYYLGVVSGDQAANTRYMKDIVIEGTQFNFLSAYITAAQNRHYITVTGYSGAVPIYTRTVMAESTNAQKVTFDFANVTEVVIHPGDPGNSWYNIILDDITVTFGLGNPPPLDSDGDGVPDLTDAFPHSRDIGTNIIIDGRDTGVLNLMFPDGSTTSDLVHEIALAARNHGQFVSGVARLKNLLRENGALTAEQAAAIQECAARSSLP